MYQDRKRLFNDIEQIVKSIFCWYLERNLFISRIFFENFKLLKEMPRYSFHFLLVSSEKYCNDFFFPEMSLTVFNFVLIN